MHFYTTTSSRFWVGAALVLGACARTPVPPAAVPALPAHQEHGAADAAKDAQAFRAVSEPLRFDVQRYTLDGQFGGTDYSRFTARVKIELRQIEASETLAFDSNVARVSEVSAIAEGKRRVLEFRTWDPLESTCRHASLSIL